MNFTSISLTPIGLGDIAKSDVPSIVSEGVPTSSTDGGVSTNWLVPFLFDGDELRVVQVDGDGYVSISMVCNALGIASHRQIKRISAHIILREGVTNVTTPPDYPGGAQKTWCLRLDLVPGWLFSISMAHVPEGPRRDKLILYQRECFRVLAKYFIADRFSVLGTAYMREWKKARRAYNRAYYSSLTQKRPRVRRPSRRLGF